MPWRDAYALNIFVPPNAPFGDNWVEQILGSVIKPVVEQYEDQLRWIWMTRYSGPYAEPDFARGHRLPEEYRSDSWYRFIVFRASVDDSSREELHNQTIQFAGKAGCFTKPSGWEPYDVVEDLGRDRFVRQNASPDERSTRALLVVRFVDAYVRLMLDALNENEEGVWDLEPNGDREQNPHGSFFESVHHLFWNSTRVPTSVLLAPRSNGLLVRTLWMDTVQRQYDPQVDSGWFEVMLQY